MKELIRAARIANCFSSGNLRAPEKRELVAASIISVLKARVNGQDS